MPVSISLLADKPDLIAAVAEMRWREWGHAPEPEDVSWWLTTTTREAGRDDLPVTFVAVDDSGHAVGAVGLDQFDLDERRDRSPWVTGTIVRHDRRQSGTGRALMERLEEWAASRGVSEAWVGTEQAKKFYRRCGWVPVETFTSRSSGQPVTVLHKRLT